MEINQVLEGVSSPEAFIVSTISMVLGQVKERVSVCCSIYDWGSVL
jgi:hypothetical protein